MGTPNYNPKYTLFFPKDIKSLPIVFKLNGADIYYKYGTIFQMSSKHFSSRDWGELNNAVPMDYQSLTVFKSKLDKYQTIEVTSLADAISKLKVLGEI